MYLFIYCTSKSTSTQWNKQINSNQMIAVKDDDAAAAAAAHADEKIHRSLETTCFI